jgi:hypothetical protein
MKRRRRRGQHLRLGSGGGTGGGGMMWREGRLEHDTGVWGRSAGRSWSFATWRLTAGVRSCGGGWSWAVCAGANGVRSGEADGE